MQEAGGEEGSVSIRLFWCRVLTNRVTGTRGRSCQNLSFLPLVWMGDWFTPCSYAVRIRRERVKHLAKHTKTVPGAMVDVVTLNSYKSL